MLNESGIGSAVVRQQHSREIVLDDVVDDVGFRMFVWRDDQAAAGIVLSGCALDGESVDRDIVGGDVEGAGDAAASSRSGDD